MKVTRNHNRCLEYLKGGAIPLLIIILSGCAADLPFYERTYAADGKQIIARDSDVEVHVLNNSGFWDIYYVNNNNKPKCVRATWEYFDLVMNVPKGLVYVKAKTLNHIGFFSEKSWKFDDLTVTVGGSGYVENINVIAPYKNRKDCLFPKKGKIS